MGKRIKIDTVRAWIFPLLAPDRIAVTNIQDGDTWRKRTHCLSDGDLTIVRLWIGGGWRSVFTTGTATNLWSRGSASPNSELLSHVNQHYDLRTAIDTFEDTPTSAALLRRITNHGRYDRATLNLCYACLGSMGWGASHRFKLVHSLAGLSLRTLNHYWMWWWGVSTNTYVAIDEWSGEVWAITPAGIVRVADRLEADTLSKIPLPASGLFDTVSLPPRFVQTVETHALSNELCGRQTDEVMNHFAGFYNLNVLGRSAIQRLGIGTTVQRASTRVGIDLRSVLIGEPTTLGRDFRKLYGLTLKRLDRTLGLTGSEALILDRSGDEPHANLMRQLTANTRNVRVTSAREEPMNLFTPQQWVSGVRGPPKNLTVIIPP